MAFCWLIFYGIVTWGSHQITHAFRWAIPMGSLITVVPLVVWLVKKGQGNLLRIRRLPWKQWKRHAYFLPYLLPVAYNVLRGSFQIPLIYDAACALCVALLEEVLFRGILLRLLCFKKKSLSIALSSAAFALCHLVNIENGAELSYVIFQTVFAYAAGFAMSGIVITCGSLIPCIVIHFLINITATDRLALMPGRDPLFWTCIIVLMICGIANTYYAGKNCVKEGCLYETVH